jgi:DNA-binding response OmpR family regulator
MPDAPIHFITSLRGWCLADEGQQLICPDGRALRLNETEQRVLARLMATPNELVQYSELIEPTRERACLVRKRLRLLINRLQQKIVTRFGSALPLRVVPGHGYRYQTICRRSVPTMRPVHSLLAP